MTYYQIPQGEIGEMLSIPLQQTARYIRDHYGEITEEEAEILDMGFTIELEQVGAVHNPVISDPVKSNFIADADSSYLREYFSVWFRQMLKHPETYL